MTYCHSEFTAYSLLIITMFKCPNLIITKINKWSEDCSIDISIFVFIVIVAIAIIIVIIAVIIITMFKEAQVSSSSILSTDGQKAASVMVIAGHRLAQRTALAFLVFLNCISICLYIWCISQLYFYLHFPSFEFIDFLSYFYLSL